MVPRGGISTLQKWSINPCWVSNAAVAWREIYKSTANPPVLFPGLLLKKKKNNNFCSKYYYQIPLIGPATLVVLEKNLPLT